MKLTKTACVITRNRADSLRLCLDCLLKQTERFDVIAVVDNSTNEETKILVESFFDSIRYYRFAGTLGDLPVQRNMAIRECASDLIYFIDDDGYAEPSWSGEIERVYLSNSDAGSVGGRIVQGDAIEIAADGSSPVGRFSRNRWSWGSFNAKGEAVLKVDILQGTNMTFRTEVLKGVGGFDATLAHGYASFEDTDACLAVRSRGYANYYNPAAVVVHGLKPREKGLPRDIGSSPALAYSFARNGTYVQLKHVPPRLLSLIGILFVVPMINARRCLMPLRNGKRRLLLSPKRVGAALAIAGGIAAGIKCWLSGKRR